MFVCDQMNVKLYTTDISNVIWLSAIILSVIHTCVQELCKLFTCKLVDNGNTKNGVEICTESL